MFSVVIPLYNKEKYIAETVQSVLQQTYSDFEIIVVNDGSTDTSEAIVKAIDDPRVQLISIDNSGVSVARNTGIEAASYGWIAFLDADDCWAPTFLEEMTNAMEEFPDQKIFASGRSRLFKNEVDRYAHQLLPKDGEMALCNYFKVIGNHMPPINSSNVVIAKTLFEEKGYFRKDQKKHEDHDLWMRLCIDEPLVFVNKELSFYRKTVSDSASQGHYTATDFKTYLNTMLLVQAKLSSEELPYFSKYVNKFVLLMYIKFFSGYTEEEREQITHLAKKLLNARYRTLLNTVNVAPFNVYALLKKLKA